MIDPNAIVTRRNDGEYSTALIGDYIETMWFPDVGEPVMIDRTYTRLSVVARRHIERHEGAGHAGLAQDQRVVDAIRQVALSVRDTAPSGRIAVSKVERIARAEIANVRSAS